MQVTALSLAPVKGMRLVAADELSLTAAGATGDRAFVVVQEDGTLLSTERTPALLQVVPAWDPAAGTLALTFPGGEVVRDEVRLGEPAQTAMYDGRVVPGRLVDGPLAAALSRHLGRPVRLLARDPGHFAADDAPLSLMSEASVTALAAATGGAVADPRRFRMAITIDGTEAFGEETWTGRTVRLGDAVLRIGEPVPRCVVVNHDPDDGTRELQPLRALAQVRGKRHVHLGVWCEIVRPGTVRLGDAPQLL